MKKLITFRTLKSICFHEYTDPFHSYCEHVDAINDDMKCSSKKCPVWKKLKEEGR